MNYKLITILLLISNSIFEQVAQFNKKHLTTCQSLQKKYDIPISVLLTIAYFESEQGKSKNVTEFNNYFNQRLLWKNNSEKGLPKLYSNSYGSFEDFCLIVNYLCKEETKHYQSYQYRLWIKIICKHQITRFTEKELIEHIEKNKIYLFDKL